MSILRLDHINIAGPPALIAKCRSFYVDVLGLVEGDRPPFRSRGFWLYAGTSPLVHLTETDAEEHPHSGPFSHFAFTCVGFEETLERLRSHEVLFSIDEVPASHQTQIFLRDPAGVGLELNFPSGDD